jgi:hypothetical protein
MELHEEPLDIAKIIQFFKELFEVLVEEIAPLSYVEVDKLCTDIFINAKLYQELPEGLQEVIKEGTWLHHWPTFTQHYCLATPTEMLNEINELFVEYS